MGITTTKLERLLHRHEVELPNPIVNTLEELYDDLLKYIAPNKVLKMCVQMKVFNNTTLSITLPCYTKPSALTTAGKGARIIYTNRLTWDTPVLAEGESLEVLTTSNNTLVEVILDKHHRLVEILAIVKYNTIH